MSHTILAQASAHAGAPRPRPTGAMVLPLPAGLDAGVLEALAAQLGQLVHFDHAVDVRRRMNYSDLKMNNFGKLGNFWKLCARFGTISANCYMNE